MPSDLINIVTSGISKLFSAERSIFPFSLLWQTVTASRKVAFNRIPGFIAFYRNPPQSSGFVEPFIL